jgi:hypothetical protein
LENKHTLTFNAIYFLEDSKYSDAERNAEINRIKALGFNESEINNMIVESKNYMTDSYGIKMFMVIELNKML